MTTSVGQANSAAPAFGGHQLMALVNNVRQRIHVVERKFDGLRGVLAEDADVSRADFTVIGTLPEMFPEWLGDRTFAETHDVRFPYIAGEMAFGISSARLVVAMAQARMLSFFGAGGVETGTLDRTLGALTSTLGDRRNWGVNLIHAPGEDRIADLLLARQVPAISLSAFTDVTPAVARCAAVGLRQDRTGAIVRPIAVFAKVSRPDVAERFMSPTPVALLRALVAQGLLTEEEGRLAARVPVAQDITIEADSAGHTDNQSLVAVLPAVLAARNTLQRSNTDWSTSIRIGAAGGLGDPAAVAAAFAMGAAYVLTGSVNQMSVEAGVSERAKAMLAAADISDVAMAPSPGQFEKGIRTQVLRRGTLFAARAAQLYRVYAAHDSIASIPVGERARLEREVFGATLDEVWHDTETHWQHRDPATAELALSDPKLRMELVFRWYMSQSVRWAVSGAPERIADYQLWCGPATGSFNRWTAGTFLADPTQRGVVQIALNLMEGAAVLTRAHQFRSFGIALPDNAYAYVPRRLRPPH
ncbi:PfaD family polyunsaturated fatty acid/polyketide biosynthesis protein [Nocardia sp. NBC_01009]|uniref:PfaD family polyunsaturated fatty acid/polyketide biosynthesis protein n=1 Tax=Nocardia sp. NBC_01009 TaxID=2975996 RepID=UPI00386AFDDA|nr:PfaD family polyunsaturated fatty acid/polyketide biosynthesis protein [Nocardia sp. NBC_01009]